MYIWTLRGLELQLIFDFMFFYLILSNIKRKKTKKKKHFLLLLLERNSTTKYKTYSGGGNQRPWAVFSSSIFSISFFSVSVRHTQNTQLTRAHTRSHTHTIKRALCLRSVGWGLPIKYPPKWASALYIEDATPFIYIINYGVTNDRFPVSKHQWNL